MIGLIDAKETCFVFEGKVSVSPYGGDNCEEKDGEGDLVVFSVAMDCRWDVHKAAVSNEYHFGA